jgi:hypothetical protein
MEKLIFSRLIGIYKNNVDWVIYTKYNTRQNNSVLAISTLG